MNKKAQVKRKREGKEEERRKEEEKKKQKKKNTFTVARFHIRCALRLGGS